MLQRMRKVSKSKISSVLLGALALSFGLWGIADIFRGNTDTSIASVGSTKIDAQEFTRDFNNLRRNASTRAGGQLSAAKAFALGQSTLQKDIDDTALDNAAHSLGLSASDNQVSSTIREIPAFHGQLGGFDQTAFRQAIDRINFTPAGFAAEIRRELVRAQLTRAGSSGIQLPPGYVHAIFSYLNERRVVQYVVLPPDAAGSIPAPSDQVLLSYVQSHPSLFSTPEYRQLTYATIGMADVENQMQVTDAQIRQSYDLRKDIYVIPEKRGIERINFPDEASARAARTKIAGGAKFEDIATARGVSAADLNLGQLTQADLGPSQGPAAFALTAGGVSDPVKYTFGWALLRVIDITPGKTTTFEEAKPELKTELVKQLAASRIEDVLNAFDDARNQGADLVEAAKKVGMRVIRVPATDEHGLAPDGAKANVPTTADFLEQVFKSDVGEEGDPFASSDGNRYVMRIDGVVPQKLKTLDAVRAQATADWIEGQRLQRLAIKAAALAQNTSLSAIAAQFHLPTQSSAALMRDEPTAVLNQNIITKIFASLPDKNVSGPSADGKSYIIAHITGVVHPPLPLGDPRFGKFAELLGNQASSDIEKSMATEARAKQGVTINQQQVDHVLGGEGT